MDLKTWQRRVFDVAKAKGFHTGPPDLAKHLMNLHSEISELWEEWRAGHAPTEVYLREDGKPEGIPTELADIVIRALDTAEALGIDLEAEMERKVAFNATRPHRHGGKLA